MKTIEQLQEENAALMAQVEALREHASDAAGALGFLSHHLRGRMGEAALMDMAEKADALSEALAATPQQHLAEIRAEAVKNEFGSILHSVANQFTGDDTTNPWHNGANHVFVLFAKEIDKRVKSIRKGEVK